MPSTGRPSHTSRVRCSTSSGILDRARLRSCRNSATLSIFDRDVNDQLDHAARALDSLSLIGRASSVIRESCPISMTMHFLQFPGYCGKTSGLTKAPQNYGPPECIGPAKTTMDRDISEAQESGVTRYRRNDAVIRSNAALISSSGAASQVDTVGVADDDVDQAVDGDREGWPWIAQSN